ncbi:MAG TPA: hypothetical protein VNO32_53365, partial [Candidatus Acidoferrum sp.]|nr:hypothetical protein [Candidatus Acidoferrum sp.]
PKRAHVTGLNSCHRARISGVSILLRRIGPRGRLPSLHTSRFNPRELICISAPGTADPQEWSITRGAVMQRDWELALNLLGTGYDWRSYREGL